LTVAAAWLASCSSSVQSGACDRWNTAEFFRTATAETVNACPQQRANVALRAQAQ